MPYAPLISKIRCHSPNSRKSANLNGKRLYDSRVRNKALVLYIATRDGVDLGVEEDLLTNNFEKELIELSKEKEINMNHGLFGNIPIPSLNDIANSIYTMTDQGKCIFNGIISLSEEDANNLGYTNRNKWELLAYKVMPDIAANLKIPIENLQWVAAVHNAKSHPHMHYMLWDKTARTRSPFIHPKVQNKIRVFLAKQVFSEEQNKLINSKNLIRDSLLSDEKDQFTDLNARAFLSIEKELGTKHFWQSDSKLPKSPLTKEELKYLTNALIDLKDNLPKSGRINYAFVDDSVKKQTTDLLNYLIEHKTELKHNINEYILLSVEQAKIYTKNDVELNKVKQNAEADINKRLCNIILRSAKELRSEESALKYQLDPNKDNPNSKDDPYYKAKYDQLSTSISYSLFSCLLSRSDPDGNSLESTYNVLKKYRSRSKQNYKNEAKKLQIKSTTFTNEIDDD